MSNGHPIINATDAVTLVLGAGNGGGTLAGTLTQPTVNGVATFSNLTISSAGSYTLQASATGLTGAASNPFTINPLPAPTIISFTPTSGAIGQVVTLTGTFFTGAAAVTFNGVAAASYTVVNDTTITALVPTGATSGPLSVTTLGGTSTSATNFALHPGADYHLVFPDQRGRGDGCDYYRHLLHRGDRSGFSRHGGNGIHRRQRYLYHRDGRQWCHGHNHCHHARRHRHQHRHLHLHPGADYHVVYPRPVAARGRW